MTTTASNPPIILIAGYWLGAWAWDDVLEHLPADRQRVIPLTLPGRDGQDPERTTRTIDDQAAAILKALNGFGGQPAVIVAHSGANVPVSVVLDRQPELVQRVVWVDSGPVASSSGDTPNSAAGMNELPLPSFDELEQQASLEGLSPQALERFRALAVPEPGPVVGQGIELTNDARHQVPTTLVCCSLSSAQVLEMARDGHPMFAEVALLEHMDVVDLPTGHWPMWSRPRDLAQVIQSAASPGS